MASKYSRRSVVTDGEETGSYRLTSGQRRTVRDSAPDCITFRPSDLQTEMTYASDFGLKFYECFCANRLGVKEAYIEHGLDFAALRRHRA